MPRDKTDLFIPVEAEEVVEEVIEETEETQESPPEAEPKPDDKQVGKKGVGGTYVKRGGVLYRA